MYLYIFKDNKPLYVCVMNTPNTHVYTHMHKWVLYHFTFFMVLFGEQFLIVMQLNINFILWLVLVLWLKITYSPKGFDVLPPAFVAQSRSARALPAHGPRMPSAQKSLGQTPLGTTRP